MSAQNETRLVRAVCALLYSASGLVIAASISIVAQRFM